LRISLPPTKIVGASTPPSCEDESLVAQRPGDHVGLGAGIARSLIVEVVDQRRREGLTVAQRAAAAPLLALPPIAYPAVLRVERVVSASALVAFEGNRASRPPRRARG
jgi:hypothetical protein